MSEHQIYYEYLENDGVKIFTVICLPEKNGKFPVTIYRTPYCDSEKEMSEDEIALSWANDHRSIMDSGYVSIYQHCRGTGKSTGDCIPYQYERTDGLYLMDWIRKQPFYNGEIFLSGGSYCCTVHYDCAPFADDIKGAVFQIQDCNHYRANFRNGFLKMGGRNDWLVEMYKKNSDHKKSYNPDWNRTFPIAEIMEKALGEKLVPFTERLMHPDKDDEFWINSPYARTYARNIPKTTKMPILIMTGMYDFYLGGIFEMWRELSPELRAKSALIIHPYGHRIAGKETFYDFPDGDVNQHFSGIVTKWYEYARGNAPAPVETGKVTYYTIFGNGWTTDSFETPKNSITFTIGKGEKSYIYNPYAPASFKGGLTNNFGNTAYQDPPNSRYDILSYYTDEFTADTIVKGQMTAKLTVKSDCEDTCFYMRISLCKSEGDLGLRDDITKISNFTDNYTKGEEITLDFSFDEHAFMVKKGEKLRIDISSSCFPHFSVHTNQKGHYALIDSAKIATNTVVLDKSSLTLFTEN